MLMWKAAVTWGDEVRDSSRSSAHLRGNERQERWEANAPLRHGYGQPQALDWGAVPKPLYPAPRVLHSPCTVS